MFIALRIGDWAFLVAAPRAWNRLPTDFKLLLKIKAQSGSSARVGYDF